MLMLKSEVERFDGERKAALLVHHWRFYVGDDGKVYLDLYQRLERPSKRHKLVATETYNRLAYSRGAFDLSYDQVPLPDDVKEEAIENLKKLFTFAGEYRR